ncbi:hypothetical protein [Caballeronia sp. LZ001]|uniref:hypothetical protein n=1 Tax=Caballeronia sp. LZ001 TaxID=3038553 RepID=UPI00286B2043|nr:hypothetical protein [Caballeronia sp. LZ001]
MRDQEIVFDRDVGVGEGKRREEALQHAEGIVGKRGGNSHVHRRVQPARQHVVRGELVFGKQRAILVA